MCDNIGRYMFGAIAAIAYLVMTNTGIFPIYELKAWWRRPIRQKMNQSAHRPMRWVDVMASIESICRKNKHKNERSEMLESGNVFSKWWSSTGNKTRILMMMMKLRCISSDAMKCETVHYLPLKRVFSAIKRFCCFPFAPIPCATPERINFHTFWMEPKCNYNCFGLPFVLRKKNPASKDLMDSWTSECLIGIDLERCASKRSRQACTEKLDETIQIKCTTELKFKPRPLNKNRPQRSILCGKLDIRLRNSPSISPRKSAVWTYTMVCVAQWPLPTECSDTHRWTHWAWRE